MKQIRYLPVIAITSLLGACAAPAPLDLNVSQVRALQDQGDSFHVALHQGYATLAQSELDEADRRDADYFNSKARHAAANGNVLPTGMDERGIPTKHVSELTQARANLMRVLNAGGATRAPEQSARAQTQFDCWMQEQEENYQPEDIAACRAGFLSAMDQASSIVFAAITPPPTPSPKVAAKPEPAKVLEIATYTIYFDHDRSDLNSAAMSMNDEIAKRIKSSEATSVTVNGYTDRSGDREYNRLLAERRAATVSAALEQTGIKPMVGSQSFGEDRSAVQTADNVRETLNRRVIVTLRK
ncbi:MAG: OmpA family protein [Rhodospirillales bacterium]